MDFTSSADAHGSLARERTNLRKQQVRLYKDCSRIEQRLAGILGNSIQGPLELLSSARSVTSSDTLLEPEFCRARLRRDGSGSTSS